MNIKRLEETDYQIKWSLNSDPLPGISHRVSVMGVFWLLGNSLWSFFDLRTVAGRRASLKAQPTGGTPAFPLGVKKRDPAFRADTWAVSVTRQWSQPPSAPYRTPKPPPAPRETTSLPQEWWLWNYRENPWCLYEYNDTTGYFIFFFPQDWWRVILPVVGVMDCLSKTFFICQALFTLFIYYFKIKTNFFTWIFSL